MAAFDYETTGIKPHAKGQRIVCASIATDANNAVVFPMPLRKSERKPFITFLQSNVKKIAANLKFEDHWSNVRLKSPVHKWHYDTMLMAHILDNRTGISGLKFQTYVQLGVVDYDNEVSSYLKAKDEKGRALSNGLNKILKFIKTPKHLRELLKYCALDSIHTYRIMEIQKEEIDNDLPF